MGSADSAPETDCNPTNQGIESRPAVSFRNLRRERASLIGMPQMKHGNPEHRQIKPIPTPTASENQKTTFQQGVGPFGVRWQSASVDTALEPDRRVKPTGSFPPTSPLAHEPTCPLAHFRIGARKNPGLGFYQERGFLLKEGGNLLSHKLYMYYHRQCCV